MSCKPKQQKASDKPTTHEETHLPNDRMDAETVRHYNGKLERELSAKASASGSEAQIWEAFEKAGGNKAALKAARKLHGQDTLKAQGFVIALRDYCIAIGVFDQTDMFEKLFLGEVAAPAPTDAESLQKINQAGLNTGMNGGNRADNPWPEGSEAHDKWNAGYDGGQKQLAAGMDSANTLKRYNAEGKAAADEGKPQSANPFEQGSDTAAAWNAGWWKGGDQDATEEASAHVPVH